MGKEEEKEVVVSTSGYNVIILLFVFFGVAGLKEERKFRISV